ncbi:hypothetical protein FACS1894211_00330 [Clostridia bacterium]|nr:hypothetical protein FACS1894211_00330 [Clostridia bacterium]
MEKIPKIDVHVHTARYRYNKIAPLYCGTSKSYASPKELIAIYDKIGVEKAVILPIVNPEASITLCNEGVYAAVREYPNRFVWFCNIDPRAYLNDPSADLSFFLEYYKKFGARGVGEVCANLPFNDLRVRNLFTHCQKTRLPVLFHIAPHEGKNYGLVDKIGLPGLESVLRDFPNLVFIGHSQPFWAEISSSITEAERNGYPSGKITEGRLAELLTRYPNLYCDMSANSGMKALMRDPEYAYRFIERFADKLLFGTDICMSDNTHPYFFSEWLEKSYNDGCISKPNYEKICYINASRLLNIKI